MAEALLSLPWHTRPLDGELLTDEMAEYAVTLIDHLLSEADRLGAQKQHFSWATKILHWLAPGQIPIFDKNVRDFLCIPEPGARERARAYRMIVRWEYAAARNLLPDREQVIGTCDPKFLLRALDKYLWWEGGGDESMACRRLEWYATTYGPKQDSDDDLETMKAAARSLQAGHKIRMYDSIYITGKGQVLDGVLEQRGRLWYVRYGDGREEPLNDGHGKLPTLQYNHQDERWEFGR